MRNRIVMIFNVWGRILGWSIVACIVGSFLFFFIWGLLLPGPASWATLIVFGLPGGLILGILSGLVNGFIMGMLMGLGGFKPKSSKAERWLLYAMSTLITAICVGFGMSLINKYIILPTVIAALIGWWVARHVLGRMVGLESATLPIESN